MTTMTTRILYEDYHSSRKLQKLIINRKNFTYRHIVELLDKYAKKERIIDVGCGVGTLDFYLASKGKKVLGLDISKNAVKMATVNAKALGVSKNVTFKVAEFPYEEKKSSYDFVLCISVLEHIRDDRKTLLEIYNLLRPKGIGFFSVPSKNSPLYRLSLTRKHDKEVGHLRRYVGRELTSSLESMGYKVLEVRNEEGFLREGLFISSLGTFIVRLANRFSLIADFLTRADNFLKIFGEAQINVIAAKK